MRGWRSLDPDTKFGNSPMRCNAENRLHQSKLEARRCDELAILERGGEITELRRQVRYPLIVNGRQVCTVIPDFDYLDRDGNPVTEDAKGVLTDSARIKYALFEALYGREISLVRRVRAR